MLFGLASTQDSPISSNETAESSFSTTFSLASASSLFFFDSETTSWVALAALGSEEALGFAFDFFESPAVFSGAATAFLLSLIGSGLLSSSFFSGAGAPFFFFGEDFVSGALSLACFAGSSFFFSGSALGFAASVVFFQALCSPQAFSYSWSFYYFLLLFPWVLLSFL